MELRFHDGNIIPYWNNNSMLESKFHDGIKIACWNQNSIMESKFHYGINIPRWNYQMNDLNRDYSTANAALFARLFLYSRKLP